MENIGTGTRVQHDRYGEGIISRTTVTSYEIFFERGGKMEISKRSEDLTVLEAQETEQAPNVDIGAFSALIEEALDKRGLLQEHVELGDKWSGGTILLQPADSSLKPKEIPIENFFHKIVMLRDRLRVLEQNINSNDKLTDEDKIHIQQYITRAYGSLTTFNVLFKNKDDFFVGSKSE